MKPLLSIPLLVFSALGQQQAAFANPPDQTDPSASEVLASFTAGDVLNTTTYSQGGRNIIVQQLALNPNHPVVPAISGREDAHHQEAVSVAPEDTGWSEADSTFHLLSVSATVFPGPVTRLRWHYQGADGDAREYTGWSNIDFHHFSGIGSFRDAAGREHSLFMGIGGSDFDEVNPSPPAFDTAIPTLLPDDPDTPAEALAALAYLHQVYAEKGPGLAAAWEAREAAHLTREAELASNPPQPKDLIIRYRIAETPLATQGGGQ